MATLSKRALVTGALGFTGRYLCSHLVNQGYEVLGLKRTPEESSDQTGTYAVVSCDLLQADKLQTLISEFQPTHIFHLAAIAFVAHGDPGEFYRTNVLGTETLLNTLTRSANAVEKVVLASSASVYGNPVHTPIPESARSHPINHYGCSKLSMELIAKTFADRLPIVFARPFNYTGPEQERRYLIPKLVDHFKSAEQSIDLGNIDVIRDYSDVRDIIEYYQVLGEQGKVGDVYNLCSGQGMSIYEIIESLQRMTGHKIEVRINPKFIRATDIQNLVGDNKKFSALSGLQARYKMERTLEDMLDHS